MRNFYRFFFCRNRSVIKNYRNSGLAVTGVEEADVSTAMCSVFGRAVLENEMEMVEESRWTNIVIRRKRRDCRFPHPKNQEDVEVEFF